MGEKVTSAAAARYNFVVRTAFGGEDKVRLKTMLELAAGTGREGSA